MIERIIAPNSTNRTADGVHPMTTSPRAVPAAGGCSVFVKTISRMLRPTDITPMKSRAKCDVAVSSPNPGIKYTRENTVPTITATTCPPMTRRLAVWRHEDNESGRCYRDNDRGPKHHVYHQQDDQQRQCGQQALEQVVSPVAAKPSVNQSALEHKAAKRPPFVQLAHHDMSCIIPPQPEMRFGPP